MPKTRSASRKETSPHILRQRPRPRVIASDSEEERGTGSSSQETPASFEEIQEYLAKAQAGLLRLNHQTSTLHEQDIKLQEEVDGSSKVSAQKPTRRSRGKHAEVQGSRDADMNVLKAKIKKLEKENRKFKDKALKDEVNDLQSGTLEEGRSDEDLVPELRKYLGRFRDLMLASTISGDVSDECPICLETVAIGKCSALTCEHFLCDDCLKKLTENAELSLNCPKCRRESLLDDLVPIHMTEQDRWDKLLEIAQDWAKSDLEGQVDTSEGEELQDESDDTSES